jgi:hypothetical protein
VGAPDPGPRPATAGRRTGASARHQGIATLVATVASAASIVAFVRYLAGVAKADVPVLPALTAPVRMLAATGGWLSGLMIDRAWLAVAAVSAAGAIAAFRIGRTRSPGWRRRFAATLLCSLAADALVLLATRHFVAAAVASAAAAGALFVHGDDEMPDSCRPRRLLVLVPLVLGLGLRLADLTRHPPGYAEHAAVHHALLSIPFYDDLRAAALHADWAALHRVWNGVVTDQHGPDSLVEALGFCVFGVNMTASRLTSAVLGTLTILLAYSAGTRLAGVRAGLIFALLLALVPWHISISRYEDAEHVLSPLQALATFYFLLGTLRRRRWRDFIGLGLTLGLSWYLYSPNQMLPLVVAAVGLTTLVERRSSPGGKAAPALVAACCFVAVSLPTVGDFIQRGRVLPVRSAYQDSADASFLSPVRLTRMAKSEVRQLFAQADDPWFSKPGGELSLVASVLLLPGAAWCAYRFGKRRDRAVSMLFLAGLPAALLPAILAPDASARRLILFALLALMLSSVVLDRVAGWLLADVRPRAVALGAVSVIAVFGAATSAHAYFDLTHAHETESHQYHQEMARFVSSRLGDRYVTIVTAHDWDVADIHRYLALAAYPTLSALTKRGASAGSVYRVANASELPALAASLPTLAGRGALVAEQFMVREPFERVDLRALVARDLPGARAFVRRAGDGTELFTWWEFEAVPGGPR